ncbi:hypothetical protein AFV6_gp27 [Betalipothrixvirus pozzuoliense]|uniref:Uncharacterized protein n=1 Tax=Betalipothrixvirus pozzuoliense TaxID=346882 RepID=A7WKI1_9VIRU|nr:hypothetical protein AFV6_gp27 [Acidianus filamentous virus 6]CAJ31581.1 conserved hypothetical protein [Acidianus filamentous virus 6]
MTYTLYISRRNFPRLDSLCKEYSSYRECILKLVEKKYGVRFEKRFNHHKRTKTGQSLCLHLYNDEVEVLKKIAEQEGTTVRKLVLSLLGIE